MAFLSKNTPKHLGLGFGLLCVMIVLCFSTDLDFWHFFLLIFFSMGFCGAFSGFLLYMLPKKRPVEVNKLDEDSSSGNNSDKLHKKPRLGCLISSCSSITSRTTTTETEECDGKNSSGGGDSSNYSSCSVIAGETTRASSTVVEPSLTNMGLEDGHMQDIDEDLHSRQLAVYGRETMRRLFASNVLVSGMQGLGAEIGKLGALIIIIK